jgi:serine O-acetyltransferase
VAEINHRKTAQAPFTNSALADTKLLQEARQLLAQDAAIGAILSIDLQQPNCDAALLAVVLGSSLADRKARQATEAEAVKVFQSDKIAFQSAIADIKTTARKNFEPGGEIATLLFSRGIHALLAHRVTHSLWSRGRRDVALALKTIFGRAFSTDIHPAAQFGRGIWLDHGLGFVVGETAVIEDDVSIWHGVTLGSTLKDAGPQRHPRVRRGATICADAILLGNIEIGTDSVVAAGSVVLSDVAPATTVAGVPARLKQRSGTSFSGI